MRLKTGITMLLSSYIGLAQAENIGGFEVLEGDERLACEATMCLASGKKPHECDPALKKFYSIKHKKRYKEIAKRRDFLDLCEEAEGGDDENNAQLMRNWQDALSQGRGVCNASELNRTNKICRRRDGDKFCYISNQMPSYCNTLYGHAWAVGLGKPYFQNGKWHDSPSLY